MRLLFVLFIALSMVSIGWADTIYPSKGPVFTSMSDMSGNAIFVNPDKPILVSPTFVSPTRLDKAYETTTRVITKWTTTSRTYEEGCPSCTTIQAVVRRPVCNQTGQKYNVTYAQIQWKGKLMEFELEHTPIVHGPLYRSITCEDSRWPLNSWFEIR